jgi:hypothetical protein
MNNYPVRYAFRLDPATEAALEQIARHTFQSKASIMRRYVQEGVEKEAGAIQHKVVYSASFASSAPQL